MKTFDPTKPVQTRSGLPARILCTDSKGSEYPIVALITKHGEEILARFAKNGHHPTLDAEYDPYDLVNIPEKVTGWINIYSRPLQLFDELITHVYTSRQQADYSVNTWAGMERIACVQITYTKGEGLS